MSRTEAPLEPVLRQVVAELEVGNPSREITCEFDVPEPISFDAGRIAQLVSNLLANAPTYGDVAVMMPTPGMVASRWLA